MKLTNEERLELLQIFSTGCSQEKAVSVFNNRHPQRPPIHQSSLSRLLSKTNKTGSIITTRKLCPSILSEEKKEDIIQSFEENPHISLRKAAALHSVSHVSVRNVVKVEKRMKPYKPQKGQRLCAPDFDKRAQFCAGLLQDLESGTIAQPTILWSDESLFHRKGFVNKQTYRWWSQTNPNWYLDNSEVGGPKVMVWAGILGEDIIGPYFFDDNIVNARTYLNMLQNYLVPELARRNLTGENIIFMQDGAPSHYSLVVRHWCDENFPLWIGRGGTYDFSWPPRSPDLTPCDFFLWGYLKDKVQRRHPQTADEIKEAIVDAIQTITPEMLRRTQHSIFKRLQKCRDENGRHARDKDVRR